MLESLNDIPWATLQHAYGSASDTPGHIERLTSKLGMIRRHAIDQLSYSIIHQGSIYSATPHAVPFLVELASSRQVEDRHSILNLLSYIASGGGWAKAHRRLNPVIQAFSPEELDERERVEREWMKQIAETFAQALPELRGLLSDSNACVRGQAVELLTRVRHDLTTTVAAMKDALERETDRSPRANLLRAVTALAAQDERAFLRGAFDANRSDALVASAAAVGVVHANADDPPRDALEFLLSSLAPVDPTVEAEYDRQPMFGDGGSYLADIADCLTVAPDTMRTRAVERILAEIESRRGFDVERVGASMLALALLPVLKHKPLTAELLDELQRRAIACIAGRAWHDSTMFGNAVDVLRAFGLPDRPAEMEALLGGAWKAPYSFREPKLNASKRWWKFW